MRGFDATKDRNGEMTDEQIRAEAERVFKDHEVKILENTENVQMFRCQKPGTWTYGFIVVCTDSMICLTGDICEMLVCQGYGRNGSAFLRGSVKSEEYFLSKVPNRREIHTEYKAQYAREVVSQMRNDFSDDPDWLKKLDELEIGEDGYYGEFKFHESWADAGLDEHPHVRKITAQTRYQLTALQWLARKLDEMDFKSGVTPVNKP